MPDILDKLFTLAAAEPLLTKVAMALEPKSPWLKEKLDKLVTDAGVQIDREMTGYQPGDAAPGTETARLWKNYEVVDDRRIQTVMGECVGLLPKEALTDEERNEFAALVQKLVPIAKNNPRIEAFRTRKFGFG